MPPTPQSLSPAPGPSGLQQKNWVGDALYNWCQTQQPYGYVFNQHELLTSGVIPGGDIGQLLLAAQYLMAKHLFKSHDVKGSDGIAWELVQPEAAKRHEGLGSDEHMVYSLIEAAGTQGIWTKTIKARLNAHTKVLDRVYKSLESKQLIKPMKSVKTPGRKMFICYHLQPSEEATGGAWFTEGRLDIDMIDAISGFVEQFCSFRSWREVVDSDEDDEDEAQIGQKRKKPDDGFEETGSNTKGKSVKTNEEAKSAKLKKHPRYEPHDPDYKGYPTIRDVSKEILTRGVIESGQALPDNALAQLMDVMAYDDKLFKLTRPVKNGELADVPGERMITMYRCFKTPNDIREQSLQRQRLERGSKKAARVQELEDIGRGGSSEVPCLSCPNFEICGPGGEINAETCVYFAGWYRQMETADRDVDDPWPTGNRPVKPNRAPQRS